MGKMFEATTFPGEKEAVVTVLKYGEKYGYGNMIAHLRRA